MAVFIVKGALRDSGKEIEYEVEAASESGARQQANADGVLVTRIFTSPQSIAYATPAAGPMQPQQFVRTIEATGKMWKLGQLIGACASMAGVIMIIVGANEKTPGTSMSALGGTLALFLGLVVFVIARIGAWWFHG